MIADPPARARRRGRLAPALARLSRLLRDRAAGGGLRDQLRPAHRPGGRRLPRPPRARGRRAGRARPLHLPPPRLADRGRLLPAGPLRRARGARHRRRAGADRGGLCRGRRRRRPNVYWLTQDVQRHRAAALRPDRHRHPLHQVPPLSRADARRPPRLPRLRRPRRLRRRCRRPPRSPRCASARSPCRAGVARSNLDLAAGLPRPHLRARERREARPPAALRAAGADLPAPRPSSPPTGPTSRRCSPASAPRPASTSPRPTTPTRRRSASRRCRRRRSPGSSPPPPASSCPGETDWQGFLRRRPASAGCAGPTRRRSAQAAIFLPLDTTPQDVRDCLNEEITQALGPANDLYRLPDSIWNDDNFHGMATPFDMTDPARALPAGAAAAA